MLRISGSNHLCAYPVKLAYVIARKLWAVVVKRAQHVACSTQLPILECQRHVHSYDYASGSVGVKIWLCQGMVGSGAQPAALRGAASAAWPETLKDKKQPCTRSKAGQKANRGGHQILVSGLL